MNIKHLTTLELPKILSRLAGLTNCDDAAELALGLQPGDTLNEVSKLMAETVHAHALMARYGSPSFGGLRNVSNALTRAEAGGALGVFELLDIGSTVRTVRLLHDWHRDNSGINGPLSILFETLQANKYLEDKIYGTIQEDGQIADSASPELHSIRRKMRAAASRVREQLEKLIRSASASKYLQEPIVTQRSGRFVVPVKAECRQQISGLLHDTSQSGATVFIEPMAVVEANNQIRELESAEQAEIDRILWELSVETGGFSDGITASYQMAVELNLCFAKARLAYEMRAMAPELNECGEIYFKNARHPLLAQASVVPVTVMLGGEFDTLMITGSNTGGKTVTLKTLGLLSLMVMCGLMIPVSDGSKAAVFSAVYCDIGDEQSIEQSLSTFSSHMVNIVDILSSADDRSLVLMDELGAGTDPIEGAALAAAILYTLREKGAHIAATTHYAELKAFALQTEGVENACCEFDVQSLRPTYRLIIGQPGRSNAFAISRRLGLSDDIIGHASSMISDSDTQFEQVVDALERSRLEYEKKTEQAQQRERQLNESLSIAKEHEQKLKIKIDRAAAESDKAARIATERLERRANEILNELNELKKQAGRENAAAMAQKARSLTKKGLEILEQNRIEMPDEEYVLPRPLKVGDTVQIAGVNRDTMLVSLDKKSAVIQAGSIRSTVPIASLRLVEKQKNTAPKSTVKYSSGRKGAMTAPSDGKTRMLGPELDIRGMNSEEGIMEMDRFIDQAVLAGHERVAVIHGRGTGVLRAAVTAHLRRHKSVKSSRLGLYGEGEDGVTVIELK